MIQLTTEPIDAQQLLELVQQPEAGAVVLFLGTTRRYTGDRETMELKYEAYREMAEREMEKLEEEARRRWKLIECAIVHRLGVVPLAEASVAIAVSSAHRDVAFDAGRWLIDTLKDSVPIWKQEHWADGEVEWVHPSERGRESFATGETAGKTTSPVAKDSRPLSLSEPPLVDGFGRRHTSLRISVTDRCNIRCFYCMPAEGVVFRPREELLSFEEIERFVRAVVPLGVNKLRLTGGEPLVRAELPELVRKLAAITGVRDVALTTNGMLLDEHAAALKAAGLHRINISLDTLREEVFRQITRRDGVDRVLAGIAAAQRAGFERIRLNAVAIHGVTESEIVPLAEFARERNLELRFIEFMPLDADRHWSSEQLLTGAAIRRTLEERFGPLVPSARADASQPALDFDFADGRGGIGFINPVSEPFCGDCNRLRLTAEGQVRNCLFSNVEWDARRLLRAGASDQELQSMVRECVAAKAAAHGIGQHDFHQPERAMYQIGG